MIEVEEKFKLTPAAETRIKEICRFEKEVVLRDRYFDFSDNRLMLADTWLRDRNGKLELKFPIHKDGHFNYAEYNEPEEIYKKFGLEYAPEDDWKKVLEKNGLSVYVNFVSTRKKYKCGEFAVDVDNTDFGYGLFEVELEVANDAEIAGAEEKIFGFIKENGIDTEHFTSGKVVVYIEKHNPKLLQALKDRGVVEIK